MQGVAWTGIGIRWDNLLQPLNEDNNFSMADIYIMLSVDIVVHSLIFWYMDALLPGDFGMPKPVYFPFTVVYFSFFLYNQSVSYLLFLYGALELGNIYLPAKFELRIAIPFGDSRTVPKVGIQIPG